MRASLIISHAVLALTIGFFSGYTVQNRLNEQITTSVNGNITQLSKDLSTRLDFGMHRRVEDTEGLANLIGITEEKNLHAILENQRNRIANLAWAGFIDKTGKVISESNQFLQNTNIKDNALFKDGIKAGTMRVIENEEFVKGLGTAGNKYMAVAVPVKNDKAATIGVLLVLIDIKWAEEVKTRLQNTIDPQIGTKIVILDKDNNILSDVNDNINSALHLIQVPPAKEGIYEEKLNENNYIIGYSHIDYLDIKWVVLAYVKHEIAYKQLTEAKLDMAKYSALFALLALICSFTMGHFLSRPIRRLEKAVKEMNVDARIPEFKSYSEIENLRDAFNSLLDEIHSGKINNEYYKSALAKTLKDKTNCEPPDEEH